ncbi:ComF family protein [candidate division WWE3 bacterium]|nr:ComF family protein [candidate division WWE3 bacterium]
MHSVLGFRHERCYRSPIDQLYSICYYHDPIASLIGEIKFYPAVRCALEVIEELTRFSSIDIECPWWSDCVVIPVPLHPFRYRMRGFNQAEEIGGIISSIFNIPMESNLLKRTSFSQPQSQMSRKDRHQNVQNAFRLNPHYRKNLPSKVLLVDDVFTTGSTLREAARLLKQTKNVTHVYAFTFARG